MAPQEGTMYGSLDLAKTKKPVARSSAVTRLLVGVTFVAIAAVTCFVTLATTGTGVAHPEATLNKDYTNKPTELKEALESATKSAFDPGHEKEDCKCKSVCKMDKNSKVPGVGTCTIDDKKNPKGKCIGFDFKYAKYVAASKTYTAACELTRGRYDCFQFPCQNGGHCVDGLDDYTCVCEFGWTDKDCETDINECNYVKGALDPKTKKKRTSENVCDENAVCTNKVVDANDKKGYECKCKTGWFGDGFQKDQKKVAYGSVLKSTGRAHESWLDRSAKGYNRAGCTDINDCDPNPCSPQLPKGKKAKCTDEGAVAFSCSCASLKKNINQRWTGQKESEDGLCDRDVKECQKTSLNNCESADKAICHETNGSFECSCREGWVGDGYSKASTPADWGKTKKAFTGCTDKDDCKVPILTNGVVTGYKSPCVRGTCKNVEPGSGKFHCTCPTGWEGHICDRDINECTRWDGKGKNPPRSELGCDFPKARCENTPGSFYCFCHNGYTGNGYVQKVRKILKGLVNPKGVATQPGCVDADDCEPRPCKNGATCTDPGQAQAEEAGNKAFICTCVVGWKGLTCETDWNECVMGIHTCHEAARCTNTAGSFTCACDKGFSGDGYRMCNRMDNCFDWEDNADVNDDTLTDYAKKIFKPQTAADIAAGKPRVLDEVKTRAYQFERGIKSNVILSAPWKDDIRLMALDAEQYKAGKQVKVKVTKCGVFDRAATPRTFAKHGACRDVIDPKVNGMFVCDCDPGWGDKQCDRDINECIEGTNLCHRYADCTNTPGSYTCKCKPGHSGDGIGSCHDIDDCTTTAACKYGFCTDLGANDFRCTCMEGYTDKLCDEDIDECGKQAHECGKLATCTNTLGSYTCKCNKGFQGTGIGPNSCADVNDCASSPCEHGECKDVGAGMYKCTCENGWTDFNCDYDKNECLLKTHNCHHTGRCVNSPGSFFCRCISGFQGDGYTCTDLDDCDPDPCDKQHGTCQDMGQNRYFCHCETGWKGTDCKTNINECSEPQYPNTCHADADCTDLHPGFDCKCKPKFYGTRGPNNECFSCTQCDTMCADGSYTCGTGPGWEVDPDNKDCVSKDRKCINKLECGKEDNCDGHASCDDSVGSFTCTCNIDPCDVKESDFDKYQPACATKNRCYFGAGTEGTCKSCTHCGGGRAPNGKQKGEYMFKEATTTSNRVCKTLVPNGWYAIETTQGGVAQCLVKWKQSGKVFPERYSWGGLADDRSKRLPKKAGEAGKGKWDGMGSADICHDPICGVCDWNGKSAKKNIYDGKEAAWAFRRLKDDLYLIMNRADNGLRCLGFESKDAPYPSLITYSEKPVEDAEGTCWAKKTAAAAAAKALDADKKEIKCSAKKPCAATQKCKFSVSMVGSWSQDLKGGSDPTNWYCGFKASGAASAEQRVRANGLAVWSVHALGCRGKWCQKRLYDNQFTLRSLARATKDAKTADSYECLYFPKSFVGQTSSPTRVPALGTRKNPGSTFGWRDEDISGDPDCGVRLAQRDSNHKDCKCVSAEGEKVEQKDQEGCVKASVTNTWACNDNDNFSQERALIENQQATWKLIFLNAFDIGV